MGKPDTENAPECIEGDEAFSRFQQLTQQLVRVPKSEIDATEAAAAREG